MFRRGYIVFRRNSAEADEWMKKRLDVLNRPRNAYFIDYSGDNAKGLAGYALSKGWTVHLFLKDAQTADNMFQREKIQLTYRTYKTECRKYLESGKLVIRFYKQMPSVRLRYFEGSFISASWYYYLCDQMREKEDSTDKNDCISEKNNVIGHDNPSFIIDKSMKEWRDMKDYWDEYIRKFIECTE